MVGGAFLDLYEALVYIDRALCDPGEGVGHFSLHLAARRADDLVGGVVDVAAPVVFTAALTVFADIDDADDIDKVIAIAGSVRFDSE